MSSIIIFSVLVVGLFIALCYTFNKSRIELESPTIAAMEARAEAAAATVRTAEPSVDRGQMVGMREEPDIAAADAEAALEEEEYYAVEEEEELPPETEEEEPVEEEEIEPVRVDVEELPDETEPAELSSSPQMSDYEYRVMLEEGGENYVLPQWMLNFFSSSDICHTLDPSDNMVIVVKLSNAENADSGMIDISVDCDMGTQTVALTFSFGSGAEAETFKSKFYLFERGDLFELGRLVRQTDMRIDVLTRGGDYQLEYVRTIYCNLPNEVLRQITDTLSKIPT
jgi:hypothetical protein